MGFQSVTGWVVGCGSEASATDCRKAKTEHGKKPNTVGELGSLPPAAPAHLSPPHYSRLSLPVLTLVRYWVLILDTLTSLKITTKEKR